MPRCSSAPRALHLKATTKPDSHATVALGVLTDRGTEYCGVPDHHVYELYLAVENIDHTRTKARTPQTNGICERFHKTMLNEFYRVAFRKKIYTSLDEPQAEPAGWRGAGGWLRPSASCASARGRRSAGGGR